MDPKRWHEVDSFFAACLERAPSERTAFLDAACAGDTALRQEVERLLEADEAGTGLLAGPPGELLALALNNGDEVGSREAETATAPATLSGRTVAHFRIGALLGSGGMGVVYEAEDSRLGRPVALKFLAPELVRDPAAKARFLKEARAASALDHPNLCTIFEAGESEDGLLFLAMPRYDGESLASRIKSGPLPVEEAVEIAVQAARGLSRAHEHGIIHCDIKPGNLFMTRDGVVKILDFGIVKLAGETEQTRLGGVLGTPSYMAPEQTRGESVDARADVWSLGVVLYEMLAGRRPFVGGSVAAVVHAVLQETPEPLSHLRPEVPAELEGIISRMLAKDPGQRHTNAAEVLADLRSALGLPTTGSLSPAAARRSRRWLAVGSLVILFILVLAAVFAIRQRERAERQAQIARSSGLVAHASPLSRDQLGLKLLLLAQASRIPQPTLDARHALASALQGAPGLLSAQDAPDSRVFAYSPDGETLALDKGMGGLQLWSTKTQRPIRTLTEENTLVSSIAFSPNGRFLAAGLIGIQDDLSIGLWEMPNGRKLGELHWGPSRGSDKQGAVRSSMILAIAFSPDSRRVTAMSDAWRFKLWTVETRQQIGTTTPLLWPSPAIRFSPDGRFLVARGQVWSIEGQRWLNSEHGITEDSAIAFSKDDRFLAIGTRNRTSIWNLAERRRVGELDSFRSAIVRIVFDDKGRFLAVADDHGAVRVWLIAEGRLLNSYFFRNPIWELAFDSDASHLAVGSRDGSTSIWLAVGESPLPPFLQAEIRAHEGPVRRLAFVPTGDKLVSESRSGSRRTWSVEGIQSPPLSRSLLSLPYKRRQSALSPDGRYLAWGDETGAIQLWSISGNRPLGSPLQHGSKTFSLAFSPDGQLLASGGPKTIRLWSVAENRLLGTLRGDGAANFVTLAFRSDGRLLASSESDGLVRFWSLQELIQVGEPLRAGNNPMQLAFGGPWLLIGGEKEAQLWSVENRSRVGAPFVASGYGRTAALSSAGQVLAERDQEVIRVWRIPQRDLLCELRPSQRESVPQDLTLSPDGKTLALTGSAAFVGTIQLWSVDSCRSLGEPLRVSTTGAITSVAFSPDGRTLVSQQRSYRSADNLILWDIDHASWRARACQIAGRNFSVAEWREFVGSEVPYECTCPDLPPAEGLTRCPNPA